MMCRFAWWTKSKRNKRVFSAVNGIIKSHFALKLYFRREIPKKKTIISNKLNSMSLIKLVKTIFAQ